MWRMCVSLNGMSSHPMDTASGLCPWIFRARIHTGWWILPFFLWRLNPEIELLLLISLHCPLDSLPTEPFYQTSISQYMNLYVPTWHVLLAKTKQCKCPLTNGGQKDVAHIHWNSTQLKGVKWPFAAVGWVIMGPTIAPRVKRSHLPCRGCGLILLWEDPLEASIFLPEKYHGQSLEGYL